MIFLREHYKVMMIKEIANLIQFQYNQITVIQKKSDRKNNLKQSSVDIIIFIQKKIDLYIKQNMNKVN